MHKLSEELAILIKNRRKELNIRQEDLSEIARVALRTIRDLEKAKGNPSLKTIQSIMDVLGIELQFNLKK